MGKRMGMRAAAVCLVVFAAMVSAAAGYAEEFEKGFAFPEAKYGSAPFWSWNEKLEQEELLLQIDEFAEKGMGGFFMHAREGLITEYMGPDWMADVRLSVDRAKEKGLIAYMYDEDRWPSGFASGKVPKMSDDFKQKALKSVKSDVPLTKEEVAAEGILLKVFEVEIADKKVKSFTDVTPGEGGRLPRRRMEKRSFILSWRQRSRRNGSTAKLISMP